MVRSVRIDYLPFTQQPSIYRESPERVRPDHNSKMAAEMVMLNEIVDASIDEELLLDNDDDGEFQLISATVAFMKRYLKRIAGFYEVVGLSYSIDEFRSHFWMTQSTFEVLTQELAAIM